MVQHCLPNQHSRVLWNRLNYSYQVLLCRLDITSKDHLVLYSLSLSSFCGCMSSNKWSSDYSTLVVYVEYFMVWNLLHGVTSYYNIFQWKGLNFHGGHASIKGAIFFKLHFLCASDKANLQIYIATESNIPFVLASASGHTSSSTGQFTHGPAEVFLQKQSLILLMVSASYIPCSNTVLM